MYRCGDTVSRCETLAGLVCEFESERPLRLRVSPFFKGDLERLETTGSRVTVHRAEHAYAPHRGKEAPGNLL